MATLKIQIALEICPDRKFPSNFVFFANIKMRGNNAALTKNVKCQTLINLTDENRFQDFNTPRPPQVNPGGNLNSESMKNFWTLSHRIFKLIH